MSAALKGGDHDVNARYSNGTTPLHQAALKGQNKIVALLIQNGARVNAKIIKDNGEIDDATPLHLAVLNSHEKVVALLIRKGANVNARYSNGTTPLDQAVIKGQNKIAALLIRKGANVNAKRYGTVGAIFTKGTVNGRSVVSKDVKGGGITPLHEAAVKGHEKLAALLIRKGAKVNTPDTKGRTPLHWSIWDGYFRFSFSEKKESSDTKASRKGYIKLVKLLIKNRANINAVDRQDQQTPLHWAAWVGNDEIVDFLIQKGASINVRDKAGKTPLALAEEQGKGKAARILKKAGARK